MHSLFHEAYWRTFGLDTFGTITDVVKILIIYVILRAALRRLINRIIVPIMLKADYVDSAHAARLRTLAGLLNSVASYALTFVFIVMLLRAFHMDPIPLLTTASVAGIAIGIGAQKLVKDVISGFFILLENQYAVGDYVTISTVISAVTMTGTIEDVGMRTTRIRDDSGRLYMVSNGDISVVCNQSRGSVASIVEIGIATGADIHKAMEVIDQAGKELSENRVDLGLVAPPQVQGLGAMDATRLTLRVSCATVNPARLLDAQIALRGLAHEQLAASGIGVA